jgi:hypothetical protein
MHRIAIGGPQCAGHQPIAKLRIRMVDGESLRREFYLWRHGAGWAGRGRMIAFSNGAHTGISFGHADASARGAAMRRRLALS